MGQNPKISIIVPVYNGEKYLDDCLYALANQGFSAGDSQIIVVNDGSTDKTEDIIDRYCSKYPYFIKINKGNQGVSSARNTGIVAALEANSEYLTFCDADDIVASNAYIKMLDICYKENLDGFYYERTNQIEQLSPPENLQYTMAEKLATGFAVSTLFRASIIQENGLRFETDMKYFEDALFEFQFGTLTKRVCYCPSQFYYYRTNTQSATQILHRDFETNSILSDAQYHWYICMLKSQKFMADYRKEHPEMPVFFIFHFNGSQVLPTFLMRAIHSGIPGEKVLKDLENINISLSDLTLSSFRSSSFFRNILGVLNYLALRNKVLFKLRCFCCRKM